MNTKGVTLVEAVIAVGLTSIVLGSILLSMMTIRSARLIAMHNTQAMNVVRGTVESLKGMAFDAIGNAQTQAAYGAGPDNVFGTADDFMGTLTVTVRDFLDMDNDGNTNEAWVDVDGDFANDQVAKPVRVDFQWKEHLSGQDKNMNVTVDTLISL